MNDLELLERYLQNEIDSGNHKIFIFDKDYNTIEFKVVNALSEIEFMKKENKQLQFNWKSLREFATLKKKPKVFGAKNGKALELAMEFVFDMVLDKMNELEKRNGE